MYSHPESLVDVEWLSEHLGDADVRVVDVHSPMGRSPEEYEAGHIPGAVLCDLINDTSDTGGSVPCRVAEPAQFADAMGRLGIGADTHVVAYDHEFGGWAARVWWSLRYYGHDKVSLLNGGLPAWVVARGPLEAGTVTAPPAEFVPVARPELRASLDDVIAAHGSDVVVVDALPGKIYRGEIPMFPGIRVGHIPGAHNVSARLNIDRATGTVLTSDQLAVLWSRLELRPEQRVIAYCGGGDYGSFDVFALYLLGHENTALYDGSWLEWGSREYLPVEVGADPGVAHSPTS